MIEPVIVRGHIGIIVARFQTPELTEGHKALIEFVESRHDKVVIILGLTTGNPTMKNPLDFAIRSNMIQKSYPLIMVLPIRDCRLDVEWSKNLDLLLDSVFPTETKVLYGSRDSFIENYYGKIPTVSLNEYGYNISASALREASSHKVENTPDFRKGMCYSIANRFKNPYLCVDVAITHPTDHSVLLCQKPGEEICGRRFVGGFVDVNDDTLEDAVIRECKEEVGLDVRDVEYISNFTVRDWRYVETEVGIKTVLFEAEAVNAYNLAMDDISNAKWFEINPMLYSLMVPEHESLMRAFLEREYYG